MARCEYSCAYLLPIAHTRLRVHRAPGIPHALCFQGGSFWQTSDALRREIAKVCPDFTAVIASEAKQSTLTFFLADQWIASLRSQRRSYNCLRLGCLKN